MRNPLIALTALTLVGCAEPREPAPEDLDGLTRFLFRSFEDPAAMERGVGNVGVWLEEQGRTVQAEQGYTVSDLTLDDTAGVQHPEHPLDGLLGVAATWSSPHPLWGHTEIQLERDQTWLDPSSYVKYLRDVAAGDPDEFLDGVDAIATDNDIEKGGAFGISIPFTSTKDYAWVPARNGLALVSRGSLREESCSDNGRNCLHHSFSLDVYYPSARGDTIRLTAVWTDLTTEADGLLTEDAKVNLALEGVISTFENQDAYLDDR